MDKKQLEQYIAEQYGVEGEHPWMKYPSYTVFRHYGSQKWFALVMDIPRNKLGLAGSEDIDVLNVKCDPILIGTLRGEKGFYPAYHMSKTTWISISLDGSVEDEKIKWLLDMSFHAAGPKKRAKE